MSPAGPNDRTAVPSSEAPSIGGYVVLRLIGHGGAGRVFAARDEQLGRTVAIKVLHPQVASDPKNVERFLREARAMATISSPHVVSIFQVGQHRGVPFIVMEYLEAQNLEQRLKKEARIPVEEALIYVRDCALALKSADAAGIVHRDVKPANILVIDGRAKLTDFGTARPMDGSADMTMEGQIAGTATFMAPERVMGKGDDRRADVYSLGATLYCLIDGQPPFVRESPMDVIAAHLNEEPVPLDQKVPGVSPVVAGLVRRMMAKQPEQRFQTYEELVTAIESILRGGARALGQEGHFDESTEVMGNAAASAPPASNQAVAAHNDPFGEHNDPFAPPPSSAFGAAPVTSSMVGEPTGVMGTLKQMSIVDICHMLEMGKKDAEIELTALEGISGELSFLGGQVVYCTWGSDVAEEAFYTVARRKEGFFRIHYGRRPQRQNIQVPTAFLVLEAMRRLDEHERGGRPPEPDFGASLDDDVSSTASAPAHAPPDTTLPSGAPIPVNSGEFSPLPDHSDEIPRGVPPASPFGAPVVGLPVPPSSPQPRAVAPRPPMGGRPPTPAPVEGLGAPAVRPAARMGRTISGGAPVARPSQTAIPAQRSRPTPAASRSDTMLMTPEDEAALRAAEGKNVPLGQRLEPLVSTLLSPITKGVAPLLRASNAQLARTAARQLEKVPGLAPLGKEVRERPWLPLAVLSSLCFALAFVAVALVSRMDKEIMSLERIDAGEATVVLAAIEAVPLKERTAKQELLRGHALAKLNRTADALIAYRAAAKLGVVDERAMGLALEHLGDENPVVAMDLLVLQPGEDVTLALLERLKSESWNVRHNAVLVLDERGAKDRVDLEALAIKDLLTGPTCNQRRVGLANLKKHGKSQAARDAFKRAFEKKDGDNGCMRPDLEEMAPK